MELSTTLSAISAAKDFAALIIGRKIDATVTEKAIELQNSIIALQTGILDMQSQIQLLSQQKRELEVMVERTAQWETEAVTHQLVAVAKGVHVVVPKAAAASPKGSPWYCANCWQKQFKSVLQYKDSNYSGTSYYCPSCAARIFDHSDPDLA